VYELLSRFHVGNLARFLGCAVVSVRCVCGRERCVFVFVSFLSWVIYCRAGVSVLMSLRLTWIVPFT